MRVVHGDKSFYGNMIYDHGIRNVQYSSKLCIELEKNNLMALKINEKFKGVTFGRKNGSSNIDLSSGFQMFSIAARPSGIKAIAQVSSLFLFMYILLDLILQRTESCSRDAAL